MVICQRPLTPQFHNSSLAQSAALAYDHINQKPRFANRAGGCSLLIVALLTG
jgi:hypothetical protein